MSKRFIVALTVGLAIPAFVLSRVIWPDPPGTAAPPPGLLPLLLVPAMFEALAFGAGIAFLISAGRALVRHQADRLSVAVCCGLGERRLGASELVAAFQYAPLQHHA